MRVATVLINGDNGPVMIDATDYDAEKHTLYEGADVLETAAGEVVPAVPEPPRNADGLRTDGPTVAEFVAAGYPASTYPPHDYASKSSAEEIAAAVAAQVAATTPSPPPVVPAVDADKPMVADFGGRFFIVDKTGEKLSGKGINPAGYTSNEKAWEAVSKLGAAE